MKLLLSTCQLRLPFTSAMKPVPAAPTAAPSVGGEPAQIDATDHKAKDQQHRPDIEEVPEALGIGHRFAGTCRFRAQAHIDGNGDDIADSRQNAGHEGGQKQLGDILFGENGVDHQNERGRDENAQRAARCERCGGKAAVIAIAAQLGQGHTAHRRGRCQRGTTDCSEPGTGPDGGHGNAALSMPEPAFRRLEKGR